ncbi:hypothetical protein [Rhodococcoides fascians]|uniref:hypothetical protein n=1 Tax=Rhodococcoides fascians TaxID=1828 RepID=UPI000562BBED|nr:hypothetical protein [Rhodococcus fascians]
MRAPTRSRVIVVSGRILLVFLLFGVAGCLISRTWIGAFVYSLCAVIAFVITRRDKGVRASAAAPAVDPLRARTKGAGT